MDCFCQGVAIYRHDTIAGIGTIVPAAEFFPRQAANRLNVQLNRVLGGGPEILTYSICALLNARGRVHLDV